MKVLVPVKNLFCWIELIKSWAEEIYFWISSKEWNNTYNYWNSFNWRNIYSNIKSYDEAKILIDFAKEKNVWTFVTVNRPPSLLNDEMIENEIKKIVDLKPDAIIFKDIYIAEIIRKVDKKISLHCSSLNQAINKESILFWINEYNVKRIILPRNLSFIEIIELCEYFPDIEFEIFVKNTWCYNSNWNFCSSLHFEWLKKWISPVCFREKNYKSEDKKLDKWFNDLDNDIHCKICILWKLKNIKNIVSLKIVWREKVLSTIMKDLKFVKRARDKLFNTNTYYEFVEWSMNIYEKEIGNKCSFEKCEYYNYYYKK